MKTILSKQEPQPAKILIIEDELPAYRRLVGILDTVLPGAEIVGHLDSIQAALDWFDKHPFPDWVFLDIHLADGSGLDLMKSIDIACPVIYTTAYDQYALDAFKTSGIDYLLKPIKKEDLQTAIQKWSKYKQIWQSAEKQTSLATGEYRQRFMIRLGEHIKSLPVTDIAYCYSSQKATFARTFKGQNYPLDYNLDSLETMLDPKDFFRINRQYIINHKAIDDMRAYTKARVVVKLQPPVEESPIVSSERAADFKQWLGA